MRGQGKKHPHIRKGEAFVLSGHAAVVYRSVMEAERKALYCTPERVAEIERRQPEALERGRALFFRPGTVTGTIKERSRPEEEEPGVVVPAWRKTFEFSGDESALADVGEELDAVVEVEAEEVLAVAAD